MSMDEILMNKIGKETEEDNQMLKKAISYLDAASGLLPVKDLKRLLSGKLQFLVTYVRFDTRLEADNISVDMATAIEMENAKSKKLSYTLTNQIDATFFILITRKTGVRTNVVRGKDICEGCIGQSLPDLCDPDALFCKKNGGSGMLHGEDPDKVENCLRGCSEEKRATRGK